MDATGMQVRACDLPPHPGARPNTRRAPPHAEHVGGMRMGGSGRVNEGLTAKRRCCGLALWAWDSGHHPRKNLRGQK
jgi:hypothetical protein